MGKSDQRAVHEGSRKDRVRGSFDYTMPWTQIAAAGSVWKSERRRGNSDQLRSTTHPDIEFREEI